MRIAILGSNGLLGTDLKYIFKNLSDYEVANLTRKDLDVTNLRQVKLKLFELRPDVIINATGFTNVKACENELSSKELAYNVNGDAIKNLAETAVDINASLVHFSSDYVFDGKEKEGYPEYYPHLRPLNVYGYSKALGETNISKIQKIVDSGKLKYYLIRTSWLFGEHGNNFVDTMLDLAVNKGKEELSAVTDEIGRPTYSLDLAKRTLEIIKNKSPFGIYHVTNDQNCSWYDFAKKIFDLTNKKIKVNPVTAEEYGSDIKRPKCSVLLNSKLPPLRTWEDALSAYLSDSKKLRKNNLI